ncbi:hypothetical protein [Sphingomonas aerolata]|uniref:hypothetical protein n=1 Tax=Sphingomonas aerolata TaxID=185951 RepID=UPI00208EE75D|nr:hypothetical protein [Sphingomonas aerolata]USR00112.1 hypothetical protein NEF64_17265 [Sphingomonas aerolata]
MPTDPNTDIERETTGEPYVEGNMETEEGVASDGTNAEGLDAVDDAPDSLTKDDPDVDDAADNLSFRGDDDDAPDSAP